MRKVFIIIGVIALTTVITVLLIILVPKPVKVEATREPVETETAEPEQLYAFDIEDAFVTNMKDSMRYVRTSISLVLNSEEDISVLEKNIFIIRDKVIGILRGVTEDEYLENQSQEKLRLQIKSELAACLSLDSLVDVYFTELVVQ